MDVQTDMGMLSCPDDDMARYYAQGYEQHLVSFLRMHLQPGWSVAQVGAHVGYITRVLAECVGEQGRVTAFEPDTLTLEHLYRNVDDLRNVWVVEAACGPEEKGRARWWRSETNSGCNTWKSGSKPPPQAPLIGRYVRVHRLSSFGPFDFILTDAQGWDAEILEEYESVWGLPENGAVIEVWADGCADRGITTHEQLQRLARFAPEQVPLEGDPGGLNQNWFLYA